MHRPSRPLSAIAIVSGFLLSLSCGGSSGGSPSEPEAPRAANVTITPAEATLNAVGETVQFTATVRDQRGREMPGHSVSWNSSDSEVTLVSSSGLATAKANGSATIIAVASSTVSGWAALTVEILELEITTASTHPGVVGEAYSLTLEATGFGDSAWSIIAGSLPTGMALDPATGLITGTPTEVGKSTFTVHLARGGQATSKEVSITVIIGNLGIDFGDDQFVLIQPGSFQMGSTNGGENEKPVHAVNITHSFFLQKTEVTQGQWQAVMGTNPSAYTTCEETCPVEHVSWDDVQVFLQALNGANPGANFRLPTEAEWEYAARAGTTGDYGGTGQLDDMGWHAGNSGRIKQYVGLKQANAWGLYDMHGNVAEWVQDWYSEDYYAVSPTDDPTGPLGGTLRVLRGGSVSQGPADERSSYRFNASPSYRGFTIYQGLRLAKTP